MAITVTRLSGVTVQPWESTPSGMLELSVIDRLPNLRMNIQTLHVFRYGHGAARVIREALSKALVPYYPLAGRLKESSHGEVGIACTGEGVWFIEAFSDRSLASFNYFDNVAIVPHSELLAAPPPETRRIDPLVQIQLTNFTCEGFVMGVTFCHSICDGLGAAQFLKAVGEFARGLPEPSVAPVWNREAIPNLARSLSVLAEPKMPPTQCFQLEHASVNISLHQINLLKKEFSELTGGYCSTFDIVAASIWRARTQAINLHKDTNVKLVFFGNTRQLLDPPLPQGFYGNCFFPVVVTVSAGWLVEASNVETVKLIKEAKARLGCEFTKWLQTEEFDDGQDPFTSSPEYTTLYISEWGRLGFNTIDYGWGYPINVIPIQGHSIMPIVIVGSPLAQEKGGIQLMTWCVNKVHMGSLIDQTRKMW